jgi:hypothetical protein
MLTTTYARTDMNLTLYVSSMPPSIYAYILEGWTFVGCYFASI